MAGRELGDHLRAQAGGATGGRRLAAPPAAITVDELRCHRGYRGAEYVDLGCSLARDGCLDPALLGAAARTGRYDDQALKPVWHLLARYGAPGMP